jgi:hypothetical protein
MARLARAEVFDPSEVAVLDVCARVVRRCFLFGVDPVTGKNHDHRKIWIEDQLRLLAANFGIDLLWQKLSNQANTHRCNVGFRPWSKQLLRPLAKGNPSTRFCPL